jgi:RNA polymerase sigma-70 factor (ECF subfamily)
LGRLFGKIELAQDLTNDTFIKANINLYKYDVKIGKMNTWLISIAKNVIIDYWRSKTSKQDRFTKIGDYVDSEGNEYFEVADSRETDIVDNNELSEILNKSIQNLKSNYREIATMFFLNQYSHEEISVLLDKPVGTVKGMIARSRAMIKESVNNMYA